MQSVIAGYHHMSEAVQAVRQLERYHSIQDLFVVDSKRRGWRKFHPDAQGRYLVAMIGRPEVITRARSLLEHSGLA